METTKAVCFRTALELCLVVRVDNIADYFLPIISDAMNRMTSAPSVPVMISLIRPSPTSLLTKPPSSHLPTQLPTIPITMFIIRPLPEPLKSLPARKPHKQPIKQVIMMPNIMMIEF